MSISATTASRNLPAMPTLKAFIAGFVDTVGFVALFGLFTAHVTGNFVLIGASVANGNPGVIGKLLALPTFIIGVALTRLLILALARKRRDAALPLITVELVALLLFMLAGVHYAPFADANSWLAIGVGMLGVLTMSVQNAGSRTTFAHLGPTTVMTGNVTQIVIDLIDLMTAVAAPETKERIRKTWPPVAGFAIGAVGGGLCYLLAGFWALLVPAAALSFLLLRLYSVGR